MLRYSLTQFILAGFVASIASPAVANNAPAHCRYENIGSFSLRQDASLPIVDGDINGQPTRFLLSTNSSATMITRAAAEKLQLPLKHSDWMAGGMSGEVKLYQAAINDVNFGKVHWHRMTMDVLYERSRSADTEADGYISSDFLFNNDVEFDLSKKIVKFFSPTNCNDAYLAYWDNNASSVPIGEMAPEDKRQYFEVEVDGHPVRAVISSSLGVTMLNRKFAEQLGFRESGENVSPALKSGGAGQHEWTFWTAQFQSLKIGDETINHPKFLVADFDANQQLDNNHTLSAEALADEPQLRLGADFLRAHHVLFAVSQRKMYFSYLGGPVFGPFPVFKQAASNPTQ